METNSISNSPLGDRGLGAEGGIDPHGYYGEFGGAYMRQRKASPLRATIIVVAGSSAEPIRINTDIIEKKRPQSIIQTAVRATGGSAVHSAAIGWGTNGCSGARPQISEAKNSDRALAPAAMSARSEPPRMKRAPISTYFLA